MIKRSDVTLIIPYLGKEKEEQYAIRECLRSLTETVPDMQKIVAKTYANDHPLTYALPQNTEYITVSEKLEGQCHKVNAVVALVDTPYVFISNADMIYAPGWFEKLVDMDQDYPCVSPKLIEPRPGAPTFEVYFCGGAGGDFDKSKWLAFAKDYTGSGIRTGFNFPVLINKKLWNTVGGYDINYDPWGSNSDSDLEYKIRLAGVQPLQNTNCIVYHFSQTSGIFHPDNHWCWQRNWDYFIRKWGFPRTDNGIWEANFHLPTREEGRIFFPEWEDVYTKYEDKYGH